MVNLLSDTLTKPTPSMLEVMFKANVGDDVFGEDPSINRLQEYAAKLFGHEAALFCPSGTMTNQIAIKVHTQPLDEIICDKDSHIWQYEGAGFAWNSGVRVEPLEGIRGKINASQIEAAIKPNYDWLAKTSLVVLENTCNRGGGSYYTLDEIAPIRELCTRQNLALHLDGARLMNALVASGENCTDWGLAFDSISLCLSKGLGAPVGSLLTGSKAFIDQARRIRKIMGGGMRQAGYLAAAGMYALQNQVNRLAEDHKRARVLAEHLAVLKNVETVRKTETNIVLFDVKNHTSADGVLQQLATKGLKGSAFGKQTIRLVTYLGISDQDIDKAKQVLSEVLD